MLISFFEEFPTKDNLAKLKLVNWPTKLYLAAKSYHEFCKITKKINHNHIKEFIYWPILEKKEGYWISPLTPRTALKRILEELKKKKVSVMLDLELPTTKNPLLYLTQSLNFFRNKKLTSDFITNYSGDIYLAEYYPEGKRQEKIMQSFGLHYPHKKAKIIKMVYHSMHNFNQDFIKRELTRGVEEYADNYLVTYGTIATGINGNEPLLEAKQLENDLKIAQKAGVKEVVIFRLGGLNNQYAQLLKKYSDG
ncbi:hypothetical protein HN662_01475 [Candidatus Woesearchaeota archaeon]|jgi:hypothetical protein|nr:hypothetical protein [Candidatus Woesearchaeota archaeon]